MPPNERIQRLTQWCRTHGVAPEALDLDGNGEIAEPEAAAALLKQHDWQRILPALDIIGVRHPLDFRHFPRKVLDRISEIASAVDARIGLPQDDPGYCDVFVPAFFEAGLPSLEEGGLCFGYPDQRPFSDPLRDPELTAQEAFEACLDRSRFFGTCSEATYKVAAAFAAAGAPCRISAVLTQSHAFPRYVPSQDIVPVDLDPSYVGGIGWEREVNAAAVYLKHGEGKTGVPSAREIANAIDPVAFPDFDKAARLILSGAVWEGLEILDAAVRENAKSVSLFLDLSSATSTMPDEQAISLSLEILRRWSENPYRLLPLLSAAGRGEKVSAELIARLSREMPATGLAETVKAFEAANSGDAKLAEALARTALDADPNNAFALGIVAGGHIQRGKFSAAREALRRAMAIAPNLSGNHSQLASILMVEGDLEEARQEARRESLVFWRNAQPYFLQTQIEFAMGRPEVARRMIEAISPQHPYAEPYRPLLASAKLMMGEIDGAREEIEASLKAFPGNPSVLLSAAGLEAADLNMGKAREYLREAASAGNSGFYLLILEASIVLAAGELDEARRVIAQAGAMLREVPRELLRLQGHLALMEGAYGEARRVGGELVRKNAYDVGGHALLVDADLFEGRLGAARERIQSLRKRFPEVHAFRSLELLLEVREGRDEAARRLMMEDRMAGRRDPYYDLLAAGVLHLSQGNYPEALDASFELMEKIPGAATGWLLAARAFMGLGDLDAARSFALAGLGKQHAPMPQWPLLDAESVLAEIDAAERGEKIPH